VSFAALRRHGRALVFAALALALAGAGATLAMPIALFPRIDFPRIVVTASAGDRPADRMMVEATRPLEQAVRSVPGIVRIRSVTSRGESQVLASFRWGADMVATELLLAKEVEAVRSALPEGTRIDVRRMDPTVFPVLGLSLTSDEVKLDRLRDLAEFTVLPVLSRIEGVARVAVLGGDVRELHVVADPAALAARGATLDDIARALGRANVLLGAGWISERGRLELVLADGTLPDAAAVERVVVKGEGPGAVRLGDVAGVEEGAEPRWTRVRADGREAVLVNVHQQRDGNTVAIAAAVRAAAAGLGRLLPRGVRLSIYYDQSDLIVESMRSVRDAIVVGLILAAAVLFGFLRSARMAALAGFSVVLSMGATVLILYVLGLSFDIMTLGAMAAATGLVIDDAIVVVEHVAAVLHRGEPRCSAVGRALAELGASLPGSSLGTIVVFVPLGFLSDVTGAFFRSLALTMVAALAMSFLFSTLVVPVLADRVLSGRDGERAADGRLFRALQRGYVRLSRPVLRRPWLVLAAAAALAPASYLVYERLGTDFLPAMDEGAFILDYRTAPGTALEKTDRILAGIERILRETPEVAAYSRRTGIRLGGGIAEANEGDFAVRLTSDRRRSLDQVMDAVRARVEAEVAGIEDVELVKLIADLIGDLTAVPQPIEVKLFGDDPAALGALAFEVAERIKKVPGIVDVLPGVVVAGDALDVRADPTLLALHGLGTDDLARAVEAAVNGNVATRVLEGERLVGVRVRLPAAKRASAADIEALLLRGSQGELVPLGRVARVDRIEGQAQITREDLKPLVAVTARIAGRDLGGVMADVKRAVAAEPLPRGVEVAYGGLYEQQQRSFRGLALVLVAAALLVFIVFLELFESFAAAAAVVLIAVLSLAGVLLALLATGTPLNVSSLVGMVMIVGIVAESAVFLVHEARRQIAAGAAPREAIVEAGRLRLRQSVMTTLAGVLALLPLALGLGAGAQMQQPLAIAVIGGFTLKTLLLVFVLPAALVALRFGVRGRVPPPGEARRAEESRLAEHAS
jgi:CzcA family heavy metal efflux pump